MSELKLQPPKEGWRGELAATKAKRCVWMDKTEARTQVHKPTTNLGHPRFSLEKLYSFFIKELRRDFIARDMRWGRLLSAQANHPAGAGWEEKVGMLRSK
jgi:hypothetical protein